MVGEHAALIYAMVLTSAADDDMTDAELQVMGELVRQLPVFRDFDIQQLPSVAASCAELLSNEDGLDTVLNLIRESLPDTLTETAYALAVEVAAVDLHAAQEELRVLELLRYRLEIDRLAAAAIERGAKARFATA